MAIPVNAYKKFIEIPDADIFTVDLGWVIFIEELVQLQDCGARES
jgi:hypothetical protein